MSGERLTDHQNGGLEKRTWILVAVICAILLGVSAIMFVPVKKAADETLPAMMVEQESAEIHSTTLTLRGTWGQQRMGKAAMTFQGVVGTAALDYTLWDGMDELDFTLSGEGREYGLLGGFFYNHFYTEDHGEGYGWLFTDHDRRHHSGAGKKFGGGAGHLRKAGCLSGSFCPGKLIRLYFQ